MIRTFSEELEARILACGNPVCFGMDPVLRLIPLDGSPEEKIRRFYLEILEECLRRSVMPAVIKPNSAYYECISIDAMRVLVELIEAYSAAGIPAVLDAKRGDIGKSSAAYADAAFSIYKADAVTVNPWMGSDSVEPFFNHPSHKGVYVLLRTSNPGAADFQDLPIQGAKQAFYSVAQKILDWDQHQNIGAVVGATHPEELESITRFFVEKNHEIPFLIPGVSIPGVPGGQGGDARAVLKAIERGGGKRKIHVLNSSSGLNFAWQLQGNPSQYAIACVDALERLADSI